MVNERYTTRIYNVSKSRYISFFTAINHTISMKTKWRRKSKRKRKSSTVTSCTSYHWRDILRPVIRALLILSAIYTLRFPLRRKSGALSPLSRTKRLLTGTWKHTHTYYTRTHTRTHTHTHAHTHTHTHSPTHTHTHTHTNTQHIRGTSTEKFFRRARRRRNDKTGRRVWYRRDSAKKRPARAGKPAV